MTGRQTVMICDFESKTSWFEGECASMVGFGKHDLLCLKMNKEWHGPLPMQYSNYSISSNKMSMTIRHREGNCPVLLQHGHLHSSSVSYIPPYVDPAPTNLMLQELVSIPSVWACSVGESLASVLGRTWSAHRSSLFHTSSRRMPCTGHWIARSKTYGSGQW